MIPYIYFITSLLFDWSLASNKYILTSKTNNVHFIAAEHNLDLLADFSDVTFYTTTHENLMKYRTTLSNFYDIEEDLEITLNFEKIGDNSFEVSDNLKVHIFDNNVTSLPWHLGRIANRDLPLSESFPYDKCHTNKDVTIHTYVIDTGIDIHHPEFEGRATWLANFADSDDTDCQSHGTHCAGLIGSKTYGVCKDAKLFAVKVLDCQGRGSTSSVISGINYAFKRHLEQDKKSEGKIRSIVSMSLGGGFSYALNKAVLSTTKDNHFYFAAAAGNEDNDACKTSPASVKEIFTVMASDRDDNRAWFSNWGKCADIYSPGVDILSTIPNGKTATYSGTSMACPALVGVLNHYIDTNPNLDMKSLKEKVLGDATKNHIVGDKKRTNNLLVFLKRT